MTPATATSSAILFGHDFLTKSFDLRMSATWVKLVSMKTDWNCCCVLVSLVLIGCGPAEKVEKVYPVSGLVTVEGQPLSGAKIQTVAFMPEDPKQVLLPTAEIGADGRYEMLTAGRKGAPLGKYKVLVWATNDPGAAGNPWGPDGKLRKVEYLIDSKYTSQETTDLSLEVTATPAAGQYDLKLSRERPN